MQEFLLQLAQSGLGTPIAILGVSYILYKVGILDTLNKKLLHSMNGSSHEERIAKIESNDIKHIEADISDIKKTQQDIKKTQNEHGNRLTALETKINN